MGGSLFIIDENICGIWRNRRQAAVKVRFVYTAQIMNGKFVKFAN